MMMIRIAAFFAVLVGTAHAKAIDLHDFTCGADGCSPNPVTVDQYGNLFGTAFYGGNHNFGVVFELVAPSHGSHSFSFTTIYNFTNGTDGGGPTAPVTVDAQGNLYGSMNVTTDARGGNVFMLTPPAQKGGAWTFQNLYLFQNGADGALGYNGTPLILANGALYGVSQTGGSSTHCTGGCGTVFYLTPGAKNAPWTYHLAYSFPGGAGGSTPLEVDGPDGNGVFYATTAGNPSLVLSLTPDGNGGLTPATLTSFHGGRFGSAAYDLVVAPGGLFGAAVGGTAKQGEVFQLTPPTGGAEWTRTTLATFKGRFAAPNSLVRNAAGAFAGVSFGEIDFGGGRVWTLTPQQDGTYTYKNIGHGTPSRNPNNVVYGLGGNLFGSMDGGDSDNGALFEILQ